MIIYNTTFLTESGDKDAFLEWFRSEALPAMVNAESPARSPRMTLVADVPGDPDFSNHACSFAFQVEFPTLAEAREWAGTYLQPVVGRFTSRFGEEHALTFSTILQEIDL